MDPSQEIAIDLGEQYSQYHLTISREVGPHLNHREFAALNVLTQRVRRAGAAALDLVYVACGRLDGYWEQDLSPWDVAAGACVVAKAGGRLSTYNGSAYDGVGHQIVVSNGHVDDAMLAKIASPRA